MPKGYAEMALPSQAEALRRWPHSLPAAALGSVGPASCLGSTVELGLVSGTLTGWPQECECRRLAPHLVYHVVARVREW